ncbi:hypothetical protein BLNAU_10341 [Blattamonas nauphoetae]|uniref:Uncharacterized protein n=1 Tax=Blattamonas nauphoetae TaxID=2049346 RepID=A0ABQ9XT78_9EUKA|nr:hypothetical protein BLNAU_10341 [Blattamonas nauphoetae]
MEIVVMCYRVAHTTAPSRKPAPFHIPIIKMEPVSSRSKLHLSQSGNAASQQPTLHLQPPSPQIDSSAKEIENFDTIPSNSVKNLALSSTMRDSLTVTVEGWAKRGDSAPTTVLHNGLSPQNALPHRLAIFLSLFDTHLHLRSPQSLSDQSHNQLRTQSRPSPSIRTFRIITVTSTSHTKTDPSHITSTDSSSNAEEEEETGDNHTLRFVQARSSLICELIIPASSTSSVGSGTDRRRGWRGR